MSDVEEFFRWADEQRQRHRVMTVGEYRAWLGAGDAISSPTSSSSFPGGLTITWGRGRRDLILGKFEDEDPHP